MSNLEDFGVGDRIHWVHVFDGDRYGKVVGTDHGFLLVESQGKTYHLSPNKAELIAKDPTR